MKKIYQIISILLAVCLLTGIVGCRKKEQKADAKYTIYQINQSGTALVPKGLRWNRKVGGRRSKRNAVCAAEV